MQRLAAVASEVARCQGADQSSSLAELEAGYAALLGHYPTEYMLFSLSAAALAQVCVGGGGRCLGYGAGAGCLAARDGRAGLA